jgi:hypothetical protein
VRARLGEACGIEGGEYFEEKRDALDRDDTRCRGVAAFRLPAAMGITLQPGAAEEGGGHAL